MEWGVVDRRTKRPPNYQARPDGSAVRIAKRSAVSRKLDLVNMGKLAWHPCEWGECDHQGCPNNTRPAPDQEDEQ